MESDSRKLFDRANELVPWGTQTNGKRPDLQIGDSQPYFFRRGEGCRLQDERGRWFTDFRSSLGPIILGYGHPEVQEAVRRQLDDGVVFSLASPLELEVAEILTSMIPGLEQVRYLKSGNEVNLASIRLARAYTGRDIVVTCGYHGHGDWFSCGSKSVMSWSWPREGNGVPSALDPLVRQVAYADTESLESLFAADGDRIAGLMMVPHDWSGRDGGDFVRRARELTEKHGSVLIFDQVLTGFRLALGGAQTYFDVIPDLTTYGKAIANGFPLAVFGGRRSVMSMLDRVMISTTHAGDALSLAAARATLGILEREPVVEHLWEMGTRLQNGFNEMATSSGLDVRNVGLAPATQFRFGGTEAENERERRVFFRGLMERGVFPSTMFLVNYAHTSKDIDLTIEAMQSTLVEMNEISV